MTTTTLNSAAASHSLVEVLVNFFKSLVSTGRPVVASEPTWADGARFI